MATSELEAGMTQEAEGQRRARANATTAPAQRTAQGQDVGGAEIGDVPGLDVAPHLLDRIEIGRVRGQPLDVQPPALACEIPVLIEQRLFQLGREIRSHMRD